MSKPAGPPSDRYLRAFTAGLSACSAQVVDVVLLSVCSALYGGHLLGCAAREPPSRPPPSAAAAQHATHAPPKKNQAKAYGQCLSARLPDVERNSCAAEFAALRACFSAQLKQLRPLRR